MFSFICLIVAILVEAQKSNDVKEREDQSPKNDETKTNDENKLESDQME